MLLVKTHPKLEYQLIKLCEKAQTKGVPLSYGPTKNKNAGLLYTDRKVTILFIEEEPDCFVVQPYVIDVSKWMWAEEEGFSREEIWQKKDLQKMIFSPVSRVGLEKYLGIN